MTPQPVRPSPSAVLSVLRRNPDMRRMYLAALVSFGGDWFLIVALQGLILETTGRPALAGLMFALLILPAAVLSPIAGVIVDRLDRRTVMVAADLGRVVLALSMMLASSRQTLWIAFAAQALMTSFGSFFQPASAAALPNLVRDPADLPLAMAVHSSAWGTMLMVGAGIGGLFTAVAGRDAAFVVDAASFLVSASLLWSIPGSFQAARAAHDTTVLQDLREGVRVARADRRIHRLLSGKAIFGITAGSVGLIAVISERSFGGGDLLTGLLLAARGLGAAPGPFVFQHAFGIDDWGLRRGVAAAYATFSVGYLMLALSPSFGWGVLAVIVAHLGGGAHWTLAGLGYQRYAHDRARGRIFGLDHTLTSLTFGLSLFGAGLLADRFDPRAVIVWLSLAGLAWAGFCAWLTRADRAADLAVEPASP